MCIKGPRYTDEALLAETPVKASIPYRRITMSVHRAYSGYVVLDSNGFVVGYGANWQEAQALLDNEK